MTRAPSCACVLPVLSALVLCAPRLPSQDEPTRVPVDTKLLREWPPESYGLYFGNSKVGWMQIGFQETTADERPVFALVMQIEMRMAALGAEMRVQGTEEQVFAGAPPHALVSGHSRTRSGDDEQVVTLRATGTGYTARITEAGATRERPAAFDYALGDAIAPYAWFRSERQPRDRLLVRSLNLSDLEIDVESYEVEANRRAIVDGVTLDYCEAKMSSRKDGEIGVFRVDRSGVILSGVVAGVMEFRREPPDVARNLDAVVDLFVHGMVKCDQPLGDPTTVTELVVRVRGKAGDRIPNGPRQHGGRDPDSGRLLLRLGKAHGRPVQATAEEIESSLRDTVEYPCADERVQALAKRAIGDAASPRERVARLLAFVDEYLDDSYSAESLTVMHTIEDKKGDCSEHAALFTALARAVGIPAREVGGLVYMGDDARAFGGHAWNEVVLDGLWVPVDPTWNEIEINATHVAYSSSGQRLDELRLLLGGLRFDVVQVVHR